MTYRVRKQKIRIEVSRISLYQSQLLARKKILIERIYDNFFVRKINKIHSLKIPYKYVKTTNIKKSFCL